MWFLKIADTLIGKDNDFLEMNPKAEINVGFLHKEYGDKVVCHCLIPSYSKIKVLLVHWLYSVHNRYK